MLESFLVDVVRKRSGSCGENEISKAICVCIFVVGVGKFYTVGYNINALM